MKIHPRIILVLLILNLLSTNCSLQKDAFTQEPTVINWENLQITPKTNNELCTMILPDELDTGDEIKQDFTSGMAVGFFPNDLSTPHKIAYDTYWVNANEQMSFNWLFWYPKGNERSLNLRLFILLDEQQLTSALPQPGSYNDLHLNKGDDIVLEVTIPPLAVGVHDVIAIAVASPENNPDVYGRVDIISNRITLIVEPTPSPPFRKIDFISLPPEGSIQRDDPAMALEVTLQDNGIDLWNWPNPWLDTNENTTVNFFALAGHQDVMNVDAPNLDELKTSFSSLLLFIDYQQVEVASNQVSLYGKLTKDTAYTRIPLEIPPQPEGKHHILVLRVDTPGVPVCLLKGDPKGRILPNNVYGKLVGINVLPSK